MNKPNQEIKTESQRRSDRAGVLSAHHTWLSAKKGVALALVAVLLIVSAAAGNFTGTNAASTKAKAKSMWVMTKGNKYSYYLDSKGKKVAKIAKKSGKYYYYTYNKKTKKWTKWTSKKGFKGKTNSIQKLKGNYFYVKKDGSLQMKKGWKKISKTYEIYIGSQGNVIVTYKKKNGKWYYKEWRTYQKTENGKKKTVTGFKKVSKELRTLSDGKIYYFNKNGVKITAKGWKTLADGRKAYVNAKGVVTKVKDADGNVETPEKETPEESTEKESTTEESTEEESTTEESKTEEQKNENLVTMSDGVVLDLSRFPETLTIEKDPDAWWDTDPTGRPRIYANRSIKSTDITYVINDGKAELVWDLNSPDLFRSNDDATSGYYVPGWNNMVAYTETEYAEQTFSNGKTEYCSDVYIYSAMTTGTFTISAYYKDTLLRTCKVTVNDTSDLAMYWRNLANEVESKAWTEEYLAKGKAVVDRAEQLVPTGRSEAALELETKLEAIMIYVKENYTYSEMDCTGGAALLYFAAKDLGLSAKYRGIYNPETGKNDVSFYEDGHNQDVYFYLNMAFAGHTCTVIEIEGHVSCAMTQGGKK